MTWAQFNTIFYDKYFPQCFRDRKISEFQELKQDRISVAEYEAKFTELAKFAPHMVDTNYKKAHKFKGGLDLDILDQVRVLNLPTYLNVMDRALMAEAILAAKNKLLSQQVNRGVRDWGLTSKEVDHSQRSKIRDLTVAQAKVVDLYPLAQTIVGNTRGFVIEHQMPVSGMVKPAM